MDIRRIPAVCRIDIVRAGGGDADKIRQRPHQHIIARSRPGLVEIELIVVIDIGVVEIVERFPALATGDAIRCQRCIEIVGAVCMPRIAHIVIITGVARGREGVVAADRVLDDLYQRFEIAVESFRTAGPAPDNYGQARCA